MPDRVPVFMSFPVCPGRHSNQIISMLKVKTNEVKVLEDLILLRSKELGEQRLNFRMTRVPFQLRTEENSALIRCRGRLF